ncbi:hypothetical protein [Myxococcus sp. CA039A]|uniref:hypothetical protein n=1 Tax=Myxococcus sp. CA039A TaxID=2741737 RepID=UPI00157B9D7A|nr:hypothetical protein [Myxococcus sp. CA039A]NTX50552.1 hypothetical protein [Myxococcus sp. CA039A]
MRSLDFIAKPALAVALCTLLVSGCGGSPQPEGDSLPGDPQTGGLEGAPGSKGSGDTGDGNEGGSGGVFNPAKIDICHIPPGNPDNAHTISVGAPALTAHLKHGDTLGACDSEPDAGTGEPDAGTGEPDAGTGEPDAGSECVSEEGACGTGTTCCEGLTCSESGYCEPMIG